MKQPLDIFIESHEIVTGIAFLLIVAIALGIVISRAVKKGNKFNDRTKYQS